MAQNNAILSKKALEMALSGLKGFETPKIRLEQYMTDPEIAADCLWTAHMSGDLAGTVADLGTGTGILGLGALLLGAKTVIMVESESSAISVAKSNLLALQEKYEIPGKAEFIDGKIENFDTKVDTVIMNPPFGTREKHADKAFLEKAMRLSTRIYSFHKLTSEGFISALCSDNGWTVFGIKPYAFPLKQTYAHHKKSIERIEVGLWILKSEA